MTDFPPPVPLRPELADVLGKAVIVNAVRDLLARADLELAAAVDAALAAGCDAQEVLVLSRAFRVT